MRNKYVDDTNTSATDAYAQEQNEQPKKKKGYRTAKSMGIIKSFGMNFLKR